MRILTLIAFLLLTAGSSSRSQEVKIGRSKLPAAVSAAFTKAWPHASITGTSREKEHGTLYYEIESLDGATHRDLLYAADGTLYETEEHIAAADLPPHAREVVHDAYPKGTITAAERVTTARATGYEVHLKSGGKMVELVFDDNGNQITKGKTKAAGDAKKLKGSDKPSAPSKEAKDDDDDDDDDDL